MNNVLEYLEKTAKEYPEKVAIRDENGYYTFSELRNKAIKIATYIQKRLNGRKNEPVMVYMKKGKECIVAFLGIVYSGNFYTPTDVRFPFHKTKEIFDSLKPTFIVTDINNSEKLKQNGISNDKIVFFEEAETLCSEECSKNNLMKGLDIDPVYVFFTSGSTGTPKGVIITHRNIIDYIDWAVPNLNINENTIMGNQSPFYFDISTQDIYACLKSAAELVIIPERLFSFPSKILEFIKIYNLNFLYWVPSAFINVCSRGALDMVDISCVRHIVFGGEIMPIKYLKVWQKAIPGLKATNVYGPTEATVNITYYHVDRDFSDEETLPLGKALDNTELVILDSDNQIVTQANVKGELCVRGTCLSPGYWRNPEKTCEAFTASIYSSIPERMYHTGDIVHFNENNELLFDGRADYQIKHLGYRIELAEIERASMSIENISNVVADYDKQRKQIVLFYVSLDSKEFDVKKSLSKLLPKYMIPMAYYCLEEIPTNANGKADRRLLHEKYIEK